MNKYHALDLDSTFWDRSVNPRFTELRIHYGYATLGSAKNPSRFIIPNETEVLRILKSNQLITLTNLDKFLQSEIKISKKLGLGTDSLEQYRNCKIIGIKP